LAASTGEEGDSEDGCWCADVLAGGIDVGADEFASQPAIVTMLATAVLKQAASHQYDGK